MYFPRFITESISMHEVTRIKNKNKNAYFKYAKRKKKKNR